MAVLRSCLVRLASGILLIAAASVVGANPRVSLSATHRDARCIGAAKQARCSRLSTFWVATDGRILLCDEGKSQIRVVSDKDRLLAVWELGFPPQAICDSQAGGFFVAGRGTLAAVDSEGKVTRRLRVESIGIPGKTTTAITRSGKDLFLACREGLGYAVYRIKTDLSESKRILKGLRGCCGQLDIAAAGDRLLVGENTRHQVGVYGRSGKLILRWGTASRSDPAGFGSCCNPMNLCCTLDGGVYTSEAGLGRIKRYDAQGRLLELVGKASIPSGCRRVTVRVGPKGRDVYVLDNRKQRVRILEVDRN